MTSKETSVTFKSGVNLVPVPVVVRDASGHAIGNLGIDDFLLFDNGKPQMISKFTVEKLVETPNVAAKAPIPQASTGADKPAATTGTLTEANTDGIPDRFVAYVFDDLHMSLSDLVYTRDAAKRQIDSAAHARERTAIYTTSGQRMQEFTSDVNKLHTRARGARDRQRQRGEDRDANIMPADDLLHGRPDLQQERFQRTRHCRDRRDQVRESFSA